MERRTFLKSAGTAFSAIVGLLTGRPSPAQLAKWTPPPRWEWEVGEWHSTPDYWEPEAWKRSGGDWREWNASVTIVPEEMPAIRDAIRKHNASAFLHVPVGQMLVEQADFQYTGDGLLECWVTLSEAETKRDDMDLFNFRWVRNFYDIFRGSHAVVSVGGEVCATRAASSASTSTT